MSEHIVPVRVYITIFLVLLVGTALTVFAAFQYFSYRIGNHELQLITVIALAIAVTKATFVVLYFMHVRYSSRLVWVIVASALFWMGIMFALTFSDYWTRGWLPVGYCRSYSPRSSVISLTSIRFLQVGQFRRIVASEVLIGAPQNGQSPLTSLCGNRSRIINTGSTRPAIS